MTDLKEVRYFIGIKIDRNKSQICLSQSAFIKNVLRKFNMEDSTPLPSKLNYEALQSVESCKAPCRNLIDCLMYIILCSRSEYINKYFKSIFELLL